MLGIGDRKRKFGGADGGGGGLMQQPLAANNGHMMQQQQYHQQHHHQQQQQPLMMMPAIGAPGPSAGHQSGSSCVLFVSEVPQNTCELELKRTFQEFGKLEQIVLMPAKHQALVEFLRVSDAERLVAMHQSGCPVTANGGQLSLCFSNHPRIDLSQESYLSSAPQTCLLLTFYAVRMEFNCDSIRQICNPYGLVDRCLLVRQQDGLLRAAVEFEKLEDAVLTKPHINGASMYAGCNSIRCEYARHTVFEYLASRETVIEEYRYEGAPGIAGAPGMMQGQGQASKRPRMPPQGGGAGIGANAAAAAAAVAASLGAAGLLMQQQLQHPPPPPPPPQQQQPLVPQMMQGGMQPPVGQMQPHHFQRRHQQQQQQLPQHASEAGHSVIVVRGLSPQMNCDRLFNVLSLFGNVARIKFVTTREGFALVQMMDAASAQQAVDFLHGQCVLGSTVKVTHSDQGLVKRGVKEFCLADGTPAEKSYDTAKLNRFMSPEAAAKNQASLGRTGRVLYYWGCPDGTTEAAIRETLKLAGASDPETVTAQGEKGSTGWITFAGVSDATDAICLANHSPMGGDTAKMKLSYAVKK